MAENIFVIDAGHGKDTEGKRSLDGSLREYMFNSVVAEYVIELLKEYQDVKTIKTHSDARDVPLKERTDKANKAKATAFVSIHANAGVSTARGIETFVQEKTASKTSKELATKVQAFMIQECGLQNRGVKAENFHVLRESEMPAILVECGFMTNAGDLVQLKSDAYRRKCAKAIVRGLVAQFGLKGKPKPATKEPVKKAIYGVKVDGKAVGSFAESRNIENAVAVAVHGGAKKVEIVLV